MDTTPTVLSVNVGVARQLGELAGLTGIDKRPTDAGVDVRAPGPKGTGGSGLVGDAVCNRKHHGGNDQAVYAYAREDLDGWERLLGRPLAPGTFGENLTTVGVDLTDARIGERWRIGNDLVLQVTDPRIPCSKFAMWLGEQGWVDTFKERGAPGAYFRVLEPGSVQTGDGIHVEHRPVHEVSIGLAFRALTTARNLLPELLAAEDDLTDELRATASRRARKLA
jgi:MOSC domain-containing protein YiiM